MYRCSVLNTVVHCTCTTVSLSSVRVYSLGLGKLKWAYCPVCIYMYTAGTCTCTCRYTVYPRGGWTWSHDTIVLREIHVHAITYMYLLWENVQELRLTGWLYMYIFVAKVCKIDMPFHLPEQMLLKPHPTPRSLKRYSY